MHILSLRVSLLFHFLFFLLTSRTCLEAFIPEALFKCVWSLSAHLKWFSGLVDIFYSLLSGCAADSQVCKSFELLSRSYTVIHNLGSKGLLCFFLFLVFSVKDLSGFVCSSSKITNAISSQAPSFFESQTFCFIYSHYQHIPQVSGN